MGKLRTRKDLEMAVVDRETQRPIKIILDPPGFDIKVRVKQSKLTYSMGVQDLLDACRSAKGGHFSLVPHKVKHVIEEPPISDEIKGILKEHNRLHFSQIRSKLKQKGIDVSKRVTGDLLKLMNQTHQVDHDERMYYFLTNKAG